VQLYAGQLLCFVRIIEKAREIALNSFSRLTHLVAPRISIVDLFWKSIKLGQRVISSQSLRENGDTLGDSHVFRLADVNR